MIQIQTYLFLESQGNASDGTLLDSLHQVSGVSSDLVPESLRLDDTHVVDNSLVDVEVIGQSAQETRLLDKREEKQRLHGIRTESDPCLLAKLLTYFP